MKMEIGERTTLRRQWLIVAILLLSLYLFRCLSAVESALPVTWAVKLHHADGASQDRLEMDAKRIAKERGLRFRGRVDPFPNIFEFELPQSTIDYHIRRRGDENWDAQGVENVLHDDLREHPSVTWVSRQVALRRVKRGSLQFEEPAIYYQWQYVW